MSLFGEYIKELQGKEIIENEYGFATYYEINGGLYIEDIYVKPDFRKSTLASKMADQIAEAAKERGLTKLYGSIRPSNKTATQAMKVLLAYGFKIDSSVIDAIGLVKELVWEL